MLKEPIVANFSKDGSGHVNDVLQIALDSNAGKNTPQWDFRKESALWTSIQLSDRT